MLSIIEESVRGGICYVINEYAKIINTYLIEYDKNKRPSCLKNLEVNNLYGQTISKKSPVGGFKWVE